MSNPEEYTVGWICALSTEYVAAQAFLNERHPPPKQVSTHDGNHYTLGSIGGHKVVIAVLPKGEYGIANAAIVARDMVHSFTNIRIGLMVGIGGGAPSPKHDIRLGDIVVSVPSGGKGGVIQYDFGKTIQHQTFQLTGFLDRPPWVLLTAVDGLQAQYEVEGHKLHEAVEDALGKRPRLRNKYQRPDPKSDRLYTSTTIHPVDCEGSCAEICGSGSTCLIHRPDRTELDDDPAVHYGLVASANQLMKDATFRDKLVEELDVLCFEMEAAGLQNHFPCLVIRGICDYSDSHKNKEWQGYAAMVAAAYARELLNNVIPSRVDSERKIVEVLAGVDEAVSKVSDKVEKVLQAQGNTQRDEVLEWLTPLEYATLQHSFFSRRQPGTGQWFLDLEEFKEWQTGKCQTLYCHGIPGAGKTIITSMVVMTLLESTAMDPEVGIAYLYCNFRQKVTVDDLLGSLLKQLAQGRPSLPTGIRQLHDQLRPRNLRPSRTNLQDVLTMVANMYSRVFIVVDALDELEAQVRTEFLTQLFALQKQTGCRIFMTARPTLNTKNEFRDCRIFTSVEILADVGDVHAYLDGQLPKLRVSLVQRDDLRQQIKETIAQSVDGMFLLAQLYFGSLEDKVSVSEIKTALSKLLKKSMALLVENRQLEALTRAYEDTMKRINGQQPGFQRLANKALSWITCADRPLKTWEIQHALAVNAGDVDMDEDNMPDIDTVLSVCAGLLTVDKETHVIRLVHYTTQEYFEQQAEWFGKAKRYVLEICFTYLSFDTFNDGPCCEDDSLEERMDQYPFHGYAVWHCGSHVRDFSSVIPEAVFAFLDNSAKVSAAFQVALAVTGYDDDPEISEEIISALHFAAFFGATELATALLQRGSPVNDRDSLMKTPLIWAASMGHEEVVELLLSSPGIEINLADKFEWTALVWAARNGHAGVARSLLGAPGINVNFQSKRGWTALFWAVGMGDEEIIRLLLSAPGIDVNAKNEEGISALLFAVDEENTETVRLLLAAPGIDVNSRSNDGSTALLWLVEEENEEMVRMLLETPGINVNAENDSGLTPLAKAVELKHEGIAQLLRAAGASE